MAECCCEPHVTSQATATLWAFDVETGELKFADLMRGSTPAFHYVRGDILCQAGVDRKIQVWRRQNVESLYRQDFQVSLKATDDKEFTTYKTSDWSQRAAFGSIATGSGACFVTPGGEIVHGLDAVSIVRNSGPIFPGNGDDKFQRFHLYNPGTDSANMGMREFDADGNLIQENPHSAVTDLFVSFAATPTGKFVGTCNVGVLFGVRASFRTWDYTDLTHPSVKIDASPFYSDGLPVNFEYLSAYDGVNWYCVNQAGTRKLRCRNASGVEVWSQVFTPDELSWAGLRIGHGATDGERLFVSGTFSGTHGIHCFNCSDGSHVWQVAITPASFLRIIDGDCLAASPAINTVAFAATNQAIRRLAGATGGEIWKTSLPDSKIWQDVSIVDGRVWLSCPASRYR